MRAKRTLLREAMLGGKDATLALLARGSKKLNLRPRAVRVSELLESPNKIVRLHAEKFLAEFEWPKPASETKVSGALEVNVVVRPASDRAIDAELVENSRPALPGASSSSLSDDPDDENFEG